MTWLEKMDAVLIGLDKVSGINPKFTDLENWIKEHYPEVSKGNIQDITLYFWKEGLMYFDDGGGWRLSDYDDRKEDGKYLISCKGKLLLDGVGGFVQQKINDDFENNRLKAIATQTLRLTLILALGAAGTLIYYGVDLYWKYNWFQSAFWWTVFAVVVCLAALTAYLTTKLLLRKKPQQE